ncbi:unnamed protein product [Caenorhabditis nigoni]
MTDWITEGGRRQYIISESQNFNALPPIVVHNNAESTVYDETPPPTYSSLDLTQLTGIRRVDESGDTGEMSENAENAEREICGRAERAEGSERAKDPERTQDPERTEEVDDTEEILHTLF